MLSYLGQSFQAREVLDLVATCREALPDVVRSLPPTVRLRTEFPDAALTVRGQRGGDPTGALQSLAQRRRGDRYR